MNIFRPIHNTKIVLLLITKHLSGILSDRTRLKIMYYLHTGRRLNLDNPSSYCEKIQWLKLYFHDDRQHIMVDKYAVKQYVADIVGDIYVIPTIGCWKSVDDIDFNALPDQFVLKTTHGGGSCGVVICHDKSTFDINEARKKLKRSMKQDIAAGSCEMPYKGVPRKIMAEPFIGNGKSAPNDFKFFCFNGTPKFLKIDCDRYSDHFANFYDMEWKMLPFGEANIMPHFDRPDNLPENFDQMVHIATKLSQGFPFLRVDLYNIAGRIYFGELTFFPCSGYIRFAPDEYEYKIGEMIKLPPII